MSTTSDEALYTVLAAAAGLTALLGTSRFGSPCIFPVEASPAEKKPMLVWQVIATNPATTHGEGGSDSRLDMVHVQLTALDATPIKCARIIYEARLAIEGSATLKGIMTGEQTLPREDDADCHGRTADFLIQNYPDANLAAPVITRSLTEDGERGVPFSYFITATHSPTSYNATGLPAGLSINTATGEISGTPTEDFSGTVVISATNAGGTGTADLELTIAEQAPTTLLHILVTGQSNALGGNATPLVTTGVIDGGKMFVGGMKPGLSLATLVDLQEEIVSVSGETGMASLVRWLRANDAGGVVYLVSNVAQDGARYTDICKGTTAYSHHMAQVAAGLARATELGLTYRVLCVVAVHEQDEAFNAGVAYRAALATWQSDYDTDCKALTGQAEDIPMIHAMQGVAGAMQYNSADLDGSSAIALFQAHFDQPAKVVIATPETYFDFLVSPHFSAGSHVWMGEQMAKVIKRVCFDEETFSPIYPSAALVAGSDIIVDFVVPVPPIRLDYAYNAYVPSAGFQYKSSDGIRYPTSVEVTGASQLTLHFSSSLTGTSKRLSYAIDNLLPKIERGSNVADSDAETPIAAPNLNNFMPAWYLNIT